MNARYCMIAAALALLAACDNKSTNMSAPAPSAPVAVAPTPTPTPNAEPTPAASAEGPTTTAAAVEPAAVAIPVPEDYEESAKKAVTSDTLDSELDKLEKTIASAPAK